MPDGSEKGSVLSIGQVFKSHLHLRSLKAQFAFPRIIIHVCGWQNRDDKKRVHGGINK